MRLAIVAFVLFQIPMATTVQAQSDSRPTATIPPQFHGRWATEGRACRPRHFTSAIKIDSRGWSSFEEGGRVIRAGQVRRGTHYFRVANWAGGRKFQASSRFAEPDRCSSCPLIRTVRSRFIID